MEQHSKRAQEVQKILLVFLREPIELIDHFVGFRRQLRAIPAAVLLNRHHQVLCSAIVQKKKPLPEAPERRGSELVRFRLTLANPIVQVRTHLMKRKVGIEVCRLVAQLWNGGVAGPERLAVAECAACFVEDVLAVCDRLWPSGLAVRWLRRRKQAHEAGKFLDVTQKIVRSDFGGIRKIVGRRLELASSLLLTL